MWSSARTAPSFGTTSIEQLLALEQRQRAQVEVLEREQIEREERRGQLDRGALDVDRRRQPPALLQAREARHSLRVEHDDFAVDDALVERQRLHGARDLREDLGVVVAVAGQEQRFTAATCWRSAGSRRA